MSKRRGGAAVQLPWARLFAASKIRPLAIKGGGHLFLESSASCSALAASQLITAASKLIVAVGRQPQCGLEGHVHAVPASRNACRFFTLLASINL